MGIYMCADMDGKLKEIDIVYPIDGGEIPVEIIEKFEMALLSSSVSLKFDKTRRIFRNSSWVRQHMGYYIKD